MEAFNRMLYDDIIKRTDVQYTIPVYQRNYTWEKENCNKLYEDIINSVKYNKNHFLGSLVYSITRRSDIKSCPIIDGQQRLTTIMLLLKALYDSIEDPENLTKQRIKKNLYNELVEERYKLKLKTTDNDNDELEKILMGNSENLDYMSKIVINYRYFKEQIEKSIKVDNLTYEDIMEGISKLQIVEIVLDEFDEPQKIFESINSTGIKLSTADLIRNFLLMGILDAGKQAEAYKNYWVTLEILIGKENIEKFFYDFLVMKDTRYIKEADVYNNFKEYYMKFNYDNQCDKEEIFKEIIKYAKYYKLLVCNDSSDYSAETNKACEMFNILKHNTIYPFLLRVCDDFSDVQNKKEKESLLKDEEKLVLSQREEEFNNILNLFGNYALRRAVAEIPSSSLRRFYASLYKNVFEKNKGNLSKYYVALESYVCLVRTNDRIPSDSVFLEGLKTKNMYRKSKILRFLFELIENDNKEPVDLSDLTIEHIMPETLSQKWIKELGENYQEIHERYLHTLGNLSITGYNSEYSNDLYIEKKKRLKSLNEVGEAKIIKLNKEILDENILVWGESQIVDRAKRLSNLILDKFSYPANVDESLDFEKYYEIYLEDLDDNEEYIGPNYKMYGFQLEGVKYRTDNYKSIFREVLKILYNKDNSILEEMAKQNHKYQYGTRIIFSKTRKNEFQEEILPNFFVVTHFNKSDLMNWIKELLDRHQIETIDFCILFVENE